MINPVISKLIEINRKPFEDSVVPNNIRYKDFREKLGLNQDEQRK